eukprot:3054609-Pleurochrysis_carterae.AAC.3
MEHELWLRLGGSKQHVKTEDAGCWPAFTDPLWAAVYTTQASGCGPFSLGPCSVGPLGRAACQQRCPRTHCCFRPARFRVCAVRGLRSRRARFARS